MRSRLSVALATLAFVLVIAVAGPAMAATHSVSAVEYSFTPKTITVSAGDTVVWTNNGKVQHTVTADGGSFDSGALSPGATFSHTFGSAGSFPYYCKFHGAPGGIGMSGTIIVQGGGTPNPSGTPLPNTGAGPYTGPFVWFGLLFLVAGTAVLVAMRRRRA